MKWLELYDGCAIRVQTSATTTDEFLASVPKRRTWDGDLEFYYNGEWLPAWDLDFLD